MSLVAVQGIPLDMKAFPNRAHARLASCRQKGSKQVAQAAAAMQRSPLQAATTACGRIWVPRKQLTVALSVYKSNTSTECTGYQQLPLGGPQQESSHCLPVHAHQPHVSHPAPCPGHHMMASGQDMIVGPAWCSG